MGLANTYSAFGPRPFLPVREALVESACRSLRETAGDYRTDAALKARVDAEEAGQARWKAEILEMALAVMEGGAAPAREPEPARPGPVEHKCDFPGCGAGAPFGFGKGREPGRWACGEHRQEVGDLWRGEQAERERVAAEALKPKHEMTGLGGRLL